MWHIIEQSYYDRICDFARELSSSKLKESHHQIDDNNEVRRHITGLLGEAAVEKLFGIDIIEWSIGDSEKYHHPDVPGYNVGIKTVEKGKYPIIFKQNDYPQIICIRDTKNSNCVYICGLATPEVLNEYQSDDLIVDDRLRARGTKTAFFGFDKLKEIKSIKDIEKYRKDKETMLNIVAVMGRFVKTPELKKTRDGVSVTSFSIANEVYGKEEANYIECVAWRNTAEMICRNCEKGQLIAIDGTLQTRNYENGNGEKRKSTEIIVNNISFCTPKKKPYDDILKDIDFNEEDLPY